jgi:hypothetical protein
MVVVDDKSITAGKDEGEWIEMVRIRSLEPIHSEIGGTTSWFEQDFDGWDWRIVTALFTTDDEDGSVGHLDGTRIPTTLLQVNQVPVLFPIGRSVDTGGTRRSIETYSLSGFE